MKKWKIALIAFLVIVIAIGGYALYELKFKSYDIADEEVDAIVEEAIEIELPDGQIIKVDKDGNIIEESNGNTQANSGNGGASNGSSEGENNNSDSSNSSGSTNSNANNGTNNNGNTNSGNGSTNSNNGSTNGSTNQGGTNAGNANNVEKITVKSIKAKYEPTFLALEEQVKARLNGLVGQAKDEYSTKKVNGEKISYGYFYRKYSTAASTMEKTSDQAVNVVLQLVEKDLEQNGFDKSHANSFKSQYEKTKEGLRSSIMKKVVPF